MSLNAIAQIYETPFSPIRSEAGVSPQLFDSLVQEGPRTASARVIPGITFSDGTPLTAALAAESLSRVDALRGQAAVDCKGDQVLFTLEAPNARFDLALTLYHCSIVLERDGQLLGTGPFTRAASASSGQVRLVRNPRYRTTVPLDEIVFQLYEPDANGRPDSLMSAINAGEVEFTNMLSRTDVTALAGVRKLIQPSNSTAILYLNVERPGLADARVRRALAMSIDRIALAEVSYSSPLAFAATGLLPPLLGAFRDDLGYNLVRARKLLSQADTKPTRLSLLLVWAPRPYLPNPRPVADALVRQLRAVGFDVAVRTPRSSEEFFRACERGDYDMVLAGWIADTPDPAEFLEANLKSNRIRSAASLPSANRSRIAMAEVDEALTSFRAEPSEPNRARLIGYLNEQAPLVPLLYGPNVIVTSWRVKNCDVSPMGIPHFAATDLK